MTEIETVEKLCEVIGKMRIIIEEQAKMIGLLTAGDEDTRSNVAKDLRNES